MSQGSSPSGRSALRRGPRLSRPWWEEFGIRVYTVRDSVYLVRSSRRGHPYQCLRLTLGAPTYSAWLETVEQGAYSMLQRSTQRKVSGTGGSLPKDIKFAKDHPLLWDHLSQTSWEDGSTRATSSVLIFQQDGTLKGRLVDHDAGLVLWVASDTVGGILDVLEAALGDPTTEWRIDRKADGDRAKRVRKSA